MRLEPCACGGMIAALAGDDRAIFAAVYRHNFTDLHAAWRQGGVG